MAESSEPKEQLHIRLSSGKRFSISVQNVAVASVLDIKKVIAEDKENQQEEKIPAERQRLIYKGKILDDAKKMAEYQIAAGSTLFMVKGAAPPSAPAPAPAPTPTPQAAPAPTAPSTNPTNPTGFGTGVGGNTGALPGMPGMPFWPPSSQQQGQQQSPFGQQQGQANNMSSLLNSPMMDSLLENPSFLQSLLERQMNENPRMQQLVQNNPELRQIWSDPNMMQQAIQMMRNPEYMQQAMRQQDLAMSQLENMPGGFAALSNMYRNIHEPMAEATAERGAETTPSNNANPASNSLEGATGTAMPNPWSTGSTNRPTVNASTSATNNAPSTNPTTNAAPANPWAAPSSQQQQQQQPGMMMPPFPFAPPGAGGEGGAPGGFGGLPGGFGGLGGQPPNLDQMMEMLNNPMVSNMMNDMVQNNPGMFRAMLEQSNPMMANMFRNNPQAADDFIRTTMNPTNLRNMIQMQQQMSQMMGGNAAGPNPMFGGGMGNPAGAGAGAGAGAAGANLDFSNLINQFQATGLGGMPQQQQQQMPDFTNFLNQMQSSMQQPPQQVSQTNPADRYRSQLRSLEDMGFDNERANITALQNHNGNLNRAVDDLLMGNVPAPTASTTSMSSSSSIASESTSPSTLGGENAAAAAAAAATTASTANEESTAAQSQGGEEKEENASPKDAVEKKND